MADTLTARGKALRWLTNHRYLTEDPAGSNSDRRRDGIRKAQIDCAGGGTWLVGQPWCGVWCFNALQAAGVHGINSRMAAVSFVEDDARAHRGCFRGWTSARAGWDGWEKTVFRGDLVVLFGRGVHVATVRDMDRDARLIRTDEGNTSSGPGGSQSNGGGSFPRWRSINDVHGFALVDYPGGATSMSAAGAADPDAAVPAAEYDVIGESSDARLFKSPEVAEKIGVPDE